ncbi:MAG: hypothetical protein Kow0069_34110 [Promethearchaeota archaeon]
MKVWSHRLFALGFCGLSCGLLAGTLVLSTLEFSFALLVAALVSSLPDWIDFHLLSGLGHRNRFTHGLPSLAFPGVLFVATSLILGASGLGLATGLSIWCGWVTHLLLDATTHSGLPFRGRRISLHLSSYDDPLANFSACIVGALLLLVGIFLREVALG